MASARERTSWVSVELFNGNALTNRSLGCHLADRDGGGRLHHVAGLRARRESSRVIRKSPVLAPYHVDGWQASKLFCCGPLLRLRC